jgi:hypothetical protein|tara:strand:- start:528 stop:710 length:183 start_codon:yes stop_codon:yes gene_type:complete
MGLSNSEVLENLLKQRVEIEQQLETLRTTYLKVLGAIDALSQIEESNAEVEEESEEEVEE